MTPKCQSLLLCGLSLKFFALNLVLLLPIVLLAVSCAVESLFTCWADLVFAEITFWCATETALLDQIGILSTLFSCFGIFISLSQVFKPLLWGVVVPRVDEVNLISADLLSGQLLGWELVQEVILILLAKVVEAVFEIRLNYLDGDLGLLSLVLQSFLLLTHAIVG